MISNILEHLERTARRVPDRVAFYDDREQLTFEQLRQAARSIGTFLGKLIPPRTPVAILIDSRSIRNLPAFLGTLYAGCFYAPMDITMPQERLAQLLSLLSPAAILADEKGRKALEGLQLSAPVIDDGAARETAADDALLSGLRRGASVQDPVSVLYTSGSTGVPKGSVQTHFSYIHWTEATINIYGLTEDTALANQSPFFYANSILEIFPPLALGATVYLLPAGVLTFPKKLIACLNDHHITELCMTPSSFISVVNAGVLTPGCCPELKWGICCGESMPWEPLKQWMQATPNASWWHFYGSTEMFSVAVGKVGKHYQAADRLPVGRPFSLVHILFLDEDGREAAPGEPGEMYLSSPWVSSGYYRDPARTAAFWAEDPLGRGWRESFFRSGDLGYIAPDGQLMVLGRKDNMIKHFGYRMELGDVEAGLRAVPQVRESCVMHQKESGRIFCFYAGDLDEKALKKALRARLAPYMLPDVFIQLPDMPHTASMKIDRAALARRMQETP